MQWMCLIISCPQFDIIAVSYFQDVDGKTSDCDLESMIEPKENFEDHVYDENMSDSRPLCETSSAILLSDDSFQKPKLGIRQKFNLLLSRFVKAKL